jgi:hypothetical protein
MFERETFEESALITVGRTNQTQSIYIPEYYRNPDEIYTLNGSSPNELKPFGGLVLKRK